MLHSHLDLEASIRQFDSPRLKQRSGLEWSVSAFCRKLPLFQAQTNGRKLPAWLSAFAAAIRTLLPNIKLFCNLSGIILIDFINMANQDHNDELFHVLQKYLRKDPVKCKAVDITPLHILEMTRKKVRRPVIEEIRQIKSGSTIADAK